MDKNLDHLFYAVLGGALAIKEKFESSNEEMKAFQEKSAEHAQTCLDEMTRRGEQETSCPVIT
jgi:hypothetical protein